MFGSLFAVMFFGFATGGGNSVKYHEFKIINRGQYLAVKIDSREAMFSYYPADLESISVDNSAIELLKGKIQIDSTSEFNSTLSEAIALIQYQMGITMDNFDVFIRNGFTKENEANAPVINCSQSSQFVPVIYFKQSNETKIYLEDSCIIAEAVNAREISMVKDRLVYGMFGIMN